MITLEIGELYGMDSVYELLEAITKLKCIGWTDSDIQEVLDRSKAGKEHKNEK